MIIGICGKTGSGKTTIAKRIGRALNGKSKYLSIDEVGHHVNELKDVKEKIRETFDESVFENEKIDRKKLAKVVFSDEKEMEKLTRCTWPAMKEKIQDFIEGNKDSIIILDWALLPKTDFWNKCDIKILVDTPYEIRKKRVMMRDSITEEEFEQRDLASPNYDDCPIDITISKDENIERVVSML